MEEEQAEPTLEERAQAVLDQLMIPTPEGIMNGEPLPEWLVQPWAAAIVDPHDPDFPSSILEAEAWLQSR